MINHEKVHTKQWHSLDTLISHIACVLFWFNPIAWLYKRALQQNLEFIADHEAQHASLCEKSYQSVLLRTSLQLNQLPITNNFYTSLIKKRIVMLHQSKSNKINKLKMIFVIPLLGVFMMSFNTEDVYVEIDHRDSVENEVTNKIQDHLNVIFSKDNTDEYLLLTKKQLSKKGITFNYKGIKRNSQNEITAIKVFFESSSNSTEYKVSGKEPIKPFSFKIDESFSVTTIGKEDGKFMYTAENGETIVQSTGTNLYTIKKTDSIFIETKGHNLIKEKDSILTNSNSKNQSWISKDGTKTNINASENGKIRLMTTQSKAPLFVLNGKIVEKAVFENLDPDHIESVFVLKDKMATEKYGDRGKNGVVIVKTKKRNPWVIGDTFEVQTYKISEPNDSITNKFEEGIYKKTNEATTYKFTSEGSYTSEPIFIVDAQEVTKKKFKGLTPDNIESLDILKDEKALKFYGEKGKNGVIIVKTKAFSDAVKKYTINNSKEIIGYDDKSKNPIYIIDERVVSATEFKLVHPDNIKSMTVLKSKNALAVYGEKGKNGAVIIITKSPNYLNRNSESKIIEVKKDSPWKVTTTQVTGVYYTGDNGEKSAELVISKTSTDSFLEKQKQELKKHGIDAKFSKVRRNKAGVITGIKISLNDDNGSKSSASWKGEKKGIPDIFMGKSKDDSLVLREIGDYFTTKQ
ncbi:hypothetical protein ES692_05845 [Psychroserpens burtonensis]|uniref:Peptidase M56 domain-containing protein n=1 Tax=Psychroserpens burtonensis TaxID=49278 RepID=A0A5C7BBL3_9FLAO|nr:hypothetical protein ES692_05845 [Psychroserpens burtonensis]